MTEATESFVLLFDILALYSHIFLYSSVLNMFSASKLNVQLSQNSPAGSSRADGKYFPCFFQRRCWGATTLCVTFIPLSSSLFFTLSTTSHVLPLPAFPSSVLLPRSPSHLFSLSLNDLIPPIPVFFCLCIYLLAYDWISLWKLPAGCGCDSSDSCWCQHELASRRCYVTVGNWLFQNAQCRKITLISVGFMTHSNHFHLIATTAKNTQR